MSWLSDFLSALNPSSREEHFMAKIAGEEELENDIIPSSREEGFMYKVAQKIQGGSLPDASEASEGDVLTIDDDGEAVWAAGGGGSGGGVVFVDCTKSGQVITATKTAGEIFGLIMDGNSVVFRLLTGSVDTLMPCLSVMRKSIGLHKFSVHLSNDIVVLMAGTASDYPTSGDVTPANPSM